MRDSNAPIINGYDCSGLVNRYSLRCEQSYPDRGDTARTLDGASQTDVFPRKIRLSWTLNSITSQQFANFNAALDASDTINLVSAVAYDPTRDALCSGNFYVTRPAFPFALAVNGSPISQAGAELILDQQGALDWISVTPPTKLAYDIGDTFDADGFRVTLTDDKDNVTDITSECSLSIADGDLLPDFGNIPVSVTRNGVQIGAFALSVGAAEVIASGAWWTLFNTGLLDIYCVGDMPNNAQYEWIALKRKFSNVVIRDSVTSIGESAFSFYSNITSVTIPDSVTSIGINAFYECYALTSVTIPASVTSIGTSAFKGCRKLKSVTILGGVTSIGQIAFDECYVLTSVTIPASVMSIGPRAFQQTKLTSVTINRDCVVGKSAFPSGCVISYYEDEEAAP